MKETMLILVDTKNNNNKFYHVTLDDNLTVTKRWGRVGSTGASSVEYTGEAGYERAINAKKRKGYKPTEVESKAKKGVNQELSKVAHTYLAKDTNDPTISSLIARLVKYNQHQIMEKSGGQITVNDSGELTTALGVVSIASIAKARHNLMKIHAKGTHQATKVTLLEEYLTLIPQKVGSRRGWEDEWFTQKKFTDQLEFLDQLESSVNFASQSQVANEDDELDISKHANLFRMKVSSMDTNSDEFKRINALYEKTKNSSHASRNMKLVNVYVVEDTHGYEAYENLAKVHGNVQELWHGTRVSNVLSILKSGFYVPPVNSGFVTGRMFGDGIYASDQSTKSLNYATGFWGGTQMNENCFMLLNDIVMGHEFRPKFWNRDSLNHAYNGVGQSGKPYQSISVRGGTCGVRNNEMIVWNTDQIRIKYLCEFSS